jgi:hypothetical protein
VVRAQLGGVGVTGSARPAADVLADLAALAQRQAQLTAELALALRAPAAAPARLEAVIVRVMRVVLALEFLAGLGAWALLGCPWPIAGLTMVASLIAFMLTWEPPHAWVPCSAPAEPISCALFGCSTPDRGPCPRCDRW